MRPRVDTRRRLYVVLAVLGLATTSLVVRAIELQYVDRAFLQSQGDQRFLREIPIPTSRGMITDRHGEPLAVSSPVESIWVNPQELLQHPERLPELSAALATPLEPLRQRIEQRAGREFVYLRRHMNPDEAEAIVERGIPGVYSQREFRRFYPMGEVMAHVLGFSNIDDRGQEGLELAYDHWLSGEPGSKKVIRDRRGRIVENVDLLAPAKPGRDLRLSIDRRIQYLAYRELKAALLEHGARSGSLVMLDVRNGEILAMVNQPSFNPNARDGVDAQARRNRAVTDLFEPGSVIKTFTVAAALEGGKVGPDTPIDTSPLSVGGHPIRDIRNFGTVTPTRLLAKSSNIASTRLALDMSNEHLHDVLRRFGFGQATGVGFPGEASGVLPPPNRWGQLHKATISFGYGLSVTALQLAQAYAAIGNRGMLTTPTFLVGADSRSRPVIAPKRAEQLLAMLEHVTGPDGSATRARVAGFRVGGKTGTSRHAVAGGYERRYISLFAGLIPVSEPRYAMVVMINEPRGEDYYGGLVAAPVFGRVMERALRVMDVPPDDIGRWLAAVPTDAPRRSSRIGEPPAEAEAVFDSVPDAAVLQ